MRTGIIRLSIARKHRCRLDAEYYLGSPDLDEAVRRAHARLKAAIRNLEEAYKAKDEVRDRVDRMLESGEGRETDG